MNRVAPWALEVVAVGTTILVHDPVELLSHTYKVPRMPRSPTASKVVFPRIRRRPAEALPKAEMLSVSLEVTSACTPALVTPEACLR